ncbi:hypothetical protein [Herbiconiux liangxiaofengii]|uniref:hypothetical protein n=1 Tax=Herbiconiux liangxiaofengii TaxID=3342795 RepID=UPI0035B8E347
MIPTYAVSIDSAVPQSASFWTPTAEELDEEGAPGDFQNTELIRTDLSEAHAVIDAEASAIRHVDLHSTTEREFDDLAADIEFEVPDVPSDEAPTFIVENNWYGVNGLELGVAGLVYALNAVGIVTSASCRSHHQEYAPWANYPIVVFAASRAQIDVLHPLVDAANCGFEIDDVNRSHLLAIVAPSVVEMMRLATSVLADSEDFPRVDN